MCDTSLFCTLLSRNQDRIFSGEVDVIHLSSHSFPCSFCDLPKDLKNVSEVESCANTALYEKDTILFALNQIANIDTQEYKKIIVFQNSSVNDLIFLLLINYFVKSNIYIHSVQDNGELNECNKNLLLKLKNIIHSSEDILIDDNNMRNKMRFLYEILSKRRDTIKYLKNGEFEYADGNRIGISILYNCSTEYNDVNIILHKVKDHFSEKFDLSHLIILKYIQDGIRQGYLLTQPLEGSNLEYSPELSIEKLYKFKIMMPGADTFKMSFNESLKETRFRQVPRKQNRSASNINTRVQHKIH